jgi:hypothetical protein
MTKPVLSNVEEVLRVLDGCCHLRRLERRPHRPVVLKGQLADPVARCGLGRGRKNVILNPACQPGELAGDRGVMLSGPIVEALLARPCRTFAAGRR